MTGLRLLEALHGHLGVLAAIALVHPAWLLRKGRPPSRGTRWATGLSAALVAGAYGLGIGIYGAYRQHVKPALFRASAEVGMLFETKEHIAYAVTGLAIGAAVLALAAPRDRGDLRRVAAGAFSVAALLCLVTACLGTYIAAVRSFPEG